MKDTAKLMYKIANIFNIILLVIMCILVVVGIIVAAVGGITGGSDEEKVAAVASGVNLLVTGIVIGIFQIVVIISAKKAIAKLNAGENSQTIHIIFLIFGIICTNIFYLLGAIFALVAINEDENKSTSEEKIEEPTKETDAFEEEEKAEEAEVVEEPATEEVENVEEEKKDEE